MDTDAKSKIDVLFKEYDTLRAEILVRITSHFNLWGVAGAAVAVWVTSRAEGLVAWMTLAGVGLVLTTIWLLNELETRRCARRIAQIEARVNNLAGDQLLEWESRWGGFAGGVNVFRKPPHDAVLVSTEGLASPASDPASEQVE